ncbi:MAG TPA: tetratricopeptide repeat protein [Blastocatellia bacterium]|nr:tetratricopeptide repeat protein [Blastocatellia bacterium]
MVVLLALTFTIVGTADADTILTLPFENVSNRQEYNWIGESFSVLMSDLLEIPGLVTIGPDERNVAFDRLGIPSGMILTKATSIKIAERTNADLLLIGTYTVQGEGDTASVGVTASLIDVREGKLIGDEFQRGGLVSDIQRIEGELAWTILYQRNPALPYSRDQMVKTATAVPLNAFESYVKAALTPEREDKILFLRRAMKEAGDKYPDAAFELGRNYYLVGDYEEAAKWLARITADDAHYTEGLFYLGVSQGYLNKLNDAQASFNTLLSKLPLYETYNNAAAIYLKKDQPKDAIPLLKTAADVAARDADVQFNYGYALWLTQDYAGAAAQMEKTIARMQQDKKNDGEAYYILAKSEHQLGKTAEAQAALDNAKKYLTTFASWETKKKVPNLARLKPQFNKKAYYQLDRTVRQEAASVRPATPAEDALAKARDLFIQNQDNDALRELGRVLQIAPDNADAHLLIGRIYERKGDYADAINALKAAAFWNPKMTSAYVLLGRIYSLQKNCPEARNYLKKALESNPKDNEGLALGRTLPTICPDK